MSLFSKLFGTTSEREIKKIKPIVDKVLSYEDEYSQLSDIDLKEKTNVFKSRLANGETLDDILPEAFATVREASWRVLEMKHYPVQIEGGIVLHQGRIAQLATGEGKTLTATLPVYLNALVGKGVHVVTVNDYLAKRDSVWMGKVYSFLGLTVGLIVNGMNNEQRRNAYACDITYGTNNEIGFDYLRDNMVLSASERVQRGFAYAIVDEVDSILIDEARTPLIISGFSGKSDEGYKIADEFVKKLSAKVIKEMENENKLEKAISQMSKEEYNEEFSDYDYVVEEKTKAVSMTERGIAKAEKFYGVANLSDPENVEINHYIQKALKAHSIFKKDVDYVIEDGKVIIVDESTGRLMYGRRYSDGIHQAIEAKEKVNIQQESKTLASITFQNLFRKYEKLSGMTGTAKTEEEEFRGIYNLDIVEIPTNKPVQRIDKNDKVYVTRKAKLAAIVDTVKECHAKGQPILIGTVSVEKSEELSYLLKKAGIKHTVLNAKYHEQEAKIVAQAGKFGAVTIATNMAGRGTDIILGGNPEYVALEELRKEGYPEELINEATGHSHTEDSEIINIRALFKEKEARIKEELRAETEAVKAAGGLYILGSERHESRRIDNQLRGRSGRQGDAGVSEFVLSLEDDLMRLFGTDKVSTICASMNYPEDMPIEAGIISNNIEKAQKRIEGHHYTIRKNTLEYDTIIAQQRDIIYDERNRLVNNEVDFVEVAEKMIADYIDRKVKDSVPHSKKLSISDYEIIKENFEEFNGIINFPDYTEDQLFDVTPQKLVNEIMTQVNTYLSIIKSSLHKESLQSFAKRVLVFLLDTYWQEHIVALDELRKGIGLRAYAQINPLDAFKSESYELFDTMLMCVREDVLKNFLNLYGMHCAASSKQTENKV